MQPLGAELGLTASEAHGAAERAVAAKLAIKDGAGKPAASPSTPLSQCSRGSGVQPGLGELLALFDAVHGGSAREQALALTLLEERLQP